MTCTKTFNRYARSFSVPAFISREKFPEYLTLHKEEFPFMKYIAKKFGSLLLTLLLVSFLSFCAFSVIPGDAAKSQLGTEATPERMEALQKEMGLDRPVLERYASWVTGFFQRTANKTNVIGCSTSTTSLSHNNRQFVDIIFTG